jgi:NAD+ synthase (glutamine-hydrolysing)
MKIAIAQLNTHIGNLEYNTGKITTSISNAAKAGADITIFSELAVTGHHPQDMLLGTGLTGKLKAIADTISANCKNTSAIVGMPWPDSTDKLHPVYNSALVIENEKITNTINKKSLSKDSYINDSKYFASGDGISTIKIGKKSITIIIGSDIWLVSDSKILSKTDLFVHITASPFAHNDDKHLSQLTALAKKTGVPAIGINQTGGNGSLIYEGRSLVINSRGEIVMQLPSFDEAVAFVTLEEIDHMKPLDNRPTDNIAEIHDALVTGIRDYFVKNKLRKATLGLSGGIDSAVVVALAAEALGHENLKVLMLPGKHSSQHSISDAVKLAQNLNIEYEIVPISAITEIVEDTLSPLFENTKKDVTEENIQARVRGLLLMAFSNKHGHILLNTSNKSEVAVGYGTLYGDMCGALAVLGDVYKTEVYRLAAYINREREIIPNNTIIKAPSAELRPDQKDSDSLPDYKILDDILFRHIELNQSADVIIAAGHDKATVERTIKMVKNNEHKRFQGAPILKVSSCAFGIDRKVPLVAYH